MRTAIIRTEHVAIGYGTVNGWTGREHEGSLRIANPSARMMKFIELGGLGKAYEFYNSPQQATCQAPSLDGLAHWPGPHG
ncbi:hypothetical protein ACFU8Q_00600 [Streptomyces sp. NPDC057543]|uniref:hypothetical protein n=1 Tax=Streptomyces sp. NPDC057543 TaxID=3346163 RepID=UPI0036C6F9FC